MMGHSRSDPITGGLRWVETVETVRFNEIDQWGIAWHGHYFSWFEAGRLALLTKFDLAPDQMAAMGFIAPIIRLNCDYKHPAGCGDEIVIRTSAVKPEIAALVFKADIKRKTDGALLACSEITQVLMTHDRKMIYRLTGEIEKRVNKLLAYCRPDDKP